MNATTSTPHETAARFLSTLAGAADPGELLELRYRLDDGERMGRVFERPARLRGLATRAIALGRRTDVYVGCAPRTRHPYHRTAHYQPRDRRALPGRHRWGPRRAGAA